MRSANKGSLLTALLLLPVALLAQQRMLAPEIVSIESVADYEEQLAVACSLGCAIGWSYQASSTLPGRDAKHYAAENLGDASLATAWVEGVAGYGEGERITITFAPIPEHSDGISFRGIELVNGYAKSEAIWRANSRVKRLAVSLAGKTLFELALEDTMSPQAFNFRDVFIHPGDRLELTILEVVRGDKYADTALSEINLYGAH